MNKNLVITVIALVAVAMTISAIAPAYAGIKVGVFDCAGPDRKIVTFNGATITHVEGDSEVDRNNNGMFCQISVAACSGEICKPRLVAEIDDHPVAPERVTPK